MNAGIQEEFLVGREPNDEERELVKWAEDAATKGITRVNDALGRMVTLLTAVLGGSTALLGSLKISGPWKAFGVVLLLVALGASLYGSLPFETTIDRTDLDDIRAARERGCNFKMSCLKIASVLLLASFVVLLAGLLLP